VEKKILTRPPNNILALGKELNPTINTAREYSVREAMSLLGMSEPGIQGYCKRKILVAERRGAKPQWFINGESMQKALLTSRRIIPFLEAIQILKDAGYKISYNRLVHLAEKKGMRKNDITPNTTGISFFDLYKIRQEFHSGTQSLSVKDAMKQVGISREQADQVIRKGLIHTITVRGLKRVPFYELQRLLDQRDRQVSLKQAVDTLAGLGLERFGVNPAYRAIHAAKIIEKSITGAKAVDKGKLQTLIQTLLRKRRLREEARIEKDNQKTEKTANLKKQLEERRSKRIAEKKELLAKAHIQPGDPRYDFLVNNHRISPRIIARNLFLINEFTGTMDLRGFADYLYRGTDYIRKRKKKLQKAIWKRDDLKEFNESVQSMPVDPRVIKKAATGGKLTKSELRNLLLLCKQNKPGAFEAMKAQWIRRINTLARIVPNVYLSIPFETRVNFGVMGLGRAIRTYSRLSTTNMAIATYFNKAIGGEIRSRCREEMGFKRRKPANRIQTVSVETLSEAERARIGYD